MFPAVFNLSSLNGTNGFTINGVYLITGWLIKGVGDVNADGLPDVAIDGPSQVYVVFGSKNPFPGEFNLSNLNGTNGFVIDIDGYISPAGDFNNDGINDILIGVDSEYWGSGYVVYGSKNNFANPFTINNITANTGVVINGYYNPNMQPAFSQSVISNLNDINADGIDDVALCVTGGNDAWYFAGMCYIIYGNNNFGGLFSVANINGNNGFTIYGINDADQFGMSIAGIGDYNGDGVSDMVIASQIDYGSVYVVFGGKNFPLVFDLTTLNGYNGFRISAINFLPNYITVAGIGDVNNDGLKDFHVIGYGSQDSYVIFGTNKISLQPSSFSNLDGNNGFYINNEDEYTVSADSLGDINNDGINDFGISNIVPGGQGQAFILYGSNNGFGNFINTSSDINGNNGFTINALNQDDLFGASISGIGDFNNDGIDDFMVSAKEDAQIYVIFGEKGSAAPSKSPNPSPTTTPSVTPSHSPIYPNQPNDNSGLPSAEIAVIAAGAAGMILLGAGIFWYGKTHGWCSGEHHANDAGYAAV